MFNIYTPEIEHPSHTFWGIQKDKKSSSDWKLDKNSQLRYSEKKKAFIFVELMKVTDKPKTSLPMVALRSRKIHAHDHHHSKSHNCMKQVMCRIIQMMLSPSFWWRFPRWREFYPTLCPERLCLVESWKTDRGTMCANVSKSLLQIRLFIGVARREEKKDLSSAFSFLRWP